MKIRNRSTTSSSLLKCAIFCLVVIFVCCAKERPYLSGHIKRAFDAIMVPCDPYGLNKFHTCIVFSAAFRESLYVYDATAGEMVLAPMGFFPLKIKVGKSTEDLITVMSAEERFLWMLGLDRNEGMVYPVRLFFDGKNKSFSEPEPQKLAHVPNKMAAVDVAGKMLAIGTFPNEGSIEIVAFDRLSGKLDPSIAPKTLNIGTRPNYVEIDHERKFAVISDEGENNIHVLDLSNIDDVLTKDSAPLFQTIPTATPVDRIHLSKRDFGDGSSLYALLLSASGNDVMLANIDKQTVDASINLEEYPMAAYFPNQKSETCCEGKKGWFSIATVKGRLIYVVVTAEAGGISLKKGSVTELASENNLTVGKLLIRKILGGYVEKDKSVDQESVCSSRRLMYLIVFYGNSRSYLNIDPHEVEAHGYLCEGEAAASRFGFKPGS